MRIGCLILSKKSKMRFDCYLLYLRPLLTSKSDLKIYQKSFKNYTGHKHQIFWQIFDICSPQNENLSKKGSKTGVEKWWNFGLESPLASRLVPGAGNGSTRPFWTLEWPQNRLKMEPFGWEIIAVRHVISVWCGTAQAFQNWREFRPCRLCFSIAKRPHSTQRARGVS